MQCIQKTFFLQFWVYSSKFRLFRLQLLRIFIRLRDTKFWHFLTIPIWSFFFLRILSYLFFSRNEDNCDFVTVQTFSSIVSLYLVIKSFFSLRFAKKVRIVRKPQLPLCIYLVAETSWHMHEEHFKSETCNFCFTSSTKQICKLN